MSDRTETHRIPDNNNVMNPKTAEGIVTVR